MSLPAPKHYRQVVRGYTPKARCMAKDCMRYASPGELCAQHWLLEQKLIAVHKARLRARDPKPDDPW